MIIRCLVNAEGSLDKLFSYAYLPASQLFYLSLVKEGLFTPIVAYHEARNALLAKYGESEDGVSYTVSGEDNINEYTRELKELEYQEIDLVIPKEKLFLCVESIEKTDKDLPVAKRLGFSANDWLAIKEIITVTEKEE